MTDDLSMFINTLRGLVKSRGCTRDTKKRSVCMGNIVGIVILVVAAVPVVVMLVKSWPRDILGGES